MQSSRSRADIIILIILLISVVSPYIASYFITSIQGVGINNFVTTVRFLCDTLIEPFIIGSVLTGFLSYIFPQKYRSYLLVGSGFMPILHSLWLGIFENKCKYQKIHTGLIQYKSGVSLSATVTYLLATPFNNFTVVFIVIIILGLKTGLDLIFALFFIAFISGVVVYILEYYKILPNAQIISRKNPNFCLMTEIKENISKIKKILTKRKLFVEHLKEMFFEIIIQQKVILKWVLLGIIVGGLISGGINEKIVSFIFGKTLIAELLVMLFAGLLQVFAESSIVISLLFYHMTGALGTMLMFLISSIVLDYITIRDIKKIMGKKVLFFFILFPLFSAFIYGFVLN